jgi:hypothetical protein
VVEGRQDFRYVMILAGLLLHYGLTLCHCALCPAPCLLLHDAQCYVIGILHFLTPCVGVSN